MRLFITGASGYLGRGLLRRVPRDWTVAASFLTHPADITYAIHVRLDVRDLAAVQRAIDEFRPDVIIHTAALMSGDAMLATNAGGTLAIARAAAQAQVRLLHLSSDVIFDGEHAPYGEDDSPDPITPYGASKAHAEQAVKEEHPAAAIVRTSLIYGFSPLDPRTQQMLNGDMPRLFTDEFRCPIFVDDIADALLELATNDYAGTLNIAGSQRLSRYEFGLKLANALNAPVRFSPALSATNPNPRPRDCTLDISRAQSLLHAPLRSVEQVLAQLRPT